jgi:hypothetical protein
VKFQGRLGYPTKKPGADLDVGRPGGKNSGSPVMRAQKAGRPQPGQGGVPPKILIYQYTEAKSNLDFHVPVTSHLLAENHVEM